MHMPCTCDPTGGGCSGREGNDAERRDEHKERRRPCAARPTAAAAALTAPAVATAPAAPAAPAAPGGCARRHNELDECQGGGGVDRPQLLVPGK